MNRRSFTLVELLIVMMLIALMASMTLMALWGVMEDARIARTQAQVAKLNELIMQQWEAYRTRAVPLKVAANTTPRNAAAMRLAALRELMRMELPDRMTDVQDPPVVLSTRPARSSNYFRRGLPTWNRFYQGAECLYLIVATMQDGDSNGLDFFKSGEIGDLDGDGMKEILDAWGNPIEFVRWPAGLDSPLQPLPRNTVLSPDPFDPLKIDPRWTDGDNTNDPFAMFPLIYSPGPDKKYDIQSDLAVGGGPPMHYGSLTNNPPSSYGPNDPYVKDSAGLMMGSRLDSDSDGRISYFDNISNHFTGNN